MGPKASFGCPPPPGGKGWCAVKGSPGGCKGGHLDGEAVVAAVAAVPGGVQLLCHLDRRGDAPPGGGGGVAPRALGGGTTGGGHPPPLPCLTRPQMAEKCGPLGSGGDMGGGWVMGDEQYGLQYITFNLEDASLYWTPMCGGQRIRSTTKGPSQKKRRRKAPSPKLIKYNNKK